MKLRHSGRDMAPDPRYDEPFHWWGPGWESPASPGIGDLLRVGAVDSWSAAVLWAALARRKSLVVAAGPSRAGKTTLLTALLEFLPPDMRRVYPRGCFETFAFLSDPGVVATETVLLINEISPHLPVYLWGPAVNRVLDAADRGFTVLATAHAETVPGFVGTLTGGPLRIPAARVASFEFVVLLGASEAVNSMQVRGIWRLSATRSGVGIEPLSAPANNISPELHKQRQSDTPTWFPPHELVKRQRLLDDYRDGRLTRLPAFR